MFYLSSAGERAELNKFCNLIGSWSGRNFFIRTATAGGIRRVDLFSGTTNGQSFAHFTLPWTTNQRKFISIHLRWQEKSPHVNSIGVYEVLRACLAYFSSAL